MEKLFSFAEINDQLHLHEAVFTEAHDGIILTDAKRIIRLVNPSFSRITGYSAEELAGKTPAILKSNRHNRQFYDAVWKKVENGGRWSGGVWDRKKNGEIYLAELTIIALTDLEGKPNAYVGVYADNTRTETALSVKTNYDPLTNLPNRILFRDHLSFMVAHARRNNRLLAVLQLDLNRFKVINDTLGHGGGDMVLINTGTRIRKVLREADRLFRLGNDEFAIVLEEVNKLEDPAKVAQKILNEIALPYQLSVFEEKLYITASIGISLFPQDGNDAETLIKNAETAMYQVKELEQNSFQHYSPDMNARSFEHLTIEHQLHKAIEQKQFVVYYQPFINSATNRIIGAEALVRWLHPDSGIIPPVKFIPIAEETGLIVPIGEFVLQTACRQAQIWQEAGHEGFSIAVNLSARQFHQYDLIKTINDVLEITGLSAESLELEITESLGMKDVQHTLKTLTALKAMGIRIAIDDFGTGYSSLSYLKKFPINTLKIDQTFVRDIPNDQDSRTIIDLIISMAHTLKLNVIAEGVETVEHLDFLRDHACDVFQGYHFSKPVPAEEFAALLKKFNGTSPSA